MMCYEAARLGYKRKNIFITFCSGVLSIQLVPPMQYPELAAHISVDMSIFFCILEHKINGIGKKKRDQICKIKNSIERKEEVFHTIISEYLTEIILDIHSSMAYSLYTGTL